MRLIDADALMERLEEEQRIHVGHAAYQGGLAGAGILIAEAPTVAMGDDHITINWTPDIDRLAREVAYQGLNTFSFLGKSIREWVEIILEQTAPVWISVKDRLPPNTNHVLALCEVSPFKKLYKCIAMYVRPHELSEGKYPEDDTFFDYDEDEDEYYLKPGWYEIGRNFGEYGSAVIEDFVTHWMPLPEPPEVEE